MASTSSRSSYIGLADVIARIRPEVFDAKDAGRAAAAVGLLLQLSPFDFSPENPECPGLLAHRRPNSV